MLHRVGRLSGAADTASEQRPPRGRPRQRSTSSPATARQAHPARRVMCRSCIIGITAAPADSSGERFLLRSGDDRRAAARLVVGPLLVEQLLVDRFDVAGRRVERDLAVARAASSCRSWRGPRASRCAWSMNGSLMTASRADVKSLLSVDGVLLRRTPGRPGWASTGCTCRASTVVLGSSPPFGIVFRNMTTLQMSSTRSRVPKFSIAVPWMPRSTR